MTTPDLDDDTPAPSATGGPRGYRVEHRLPGEPPRLLATLADCAAHPHTLTPFAARLRLDGEARGEVVLVDAATGAVLARRDQARPVRRVGWFGG